MNSSVRATSRLAALGAVLAVAAGGLLLAQPAAATTPGAVTLTPSTTGNPGAAVTAVGTKDSVVVNGTGFSGGEVFVAQCLESFDPLTGAPDQCNEGSYVGTSGSSFTVTIPLDQTFETWNPHPWGTGSSPVDCTTQQCKVIAADHNTSPVQWGYSDIDWQ